MQKIGSAPNVDLWIRRMDHQLEAAMMLSVAGGDLYQTSSNIANPRIVNRAEAIHMCHVLIVHGNGDRPNNPTHRLGDPEMILRPFEIDVFNAMQIGGRILRNCTAGQQTVIVQPQNLRVIFWVIAA